jgi:hypothetical protein
MKSAINAVRWLFSIIFGIVLSALVFVTPLATAISSALSNRETLKVWVNESGIYEHSDELAIEFIKQQAQSSSENNQMDAAEKILAERNLEKILTGVLTPDFSRELIEGTIDGTYDYLEGKTEGIVIHADKEKVEDVFFQILLASSNLEFDSLDELKDLPTCTPAQEENLDKGFESLEDACLPKDLVIDKFFEIQPDQPDGTLDITSGGINTEQIEENFPVRTVFQTAKVAPYLLFSGIILFAALTIIFNPRWKSAFIFTGIMGVIPSLISLGIAVFIYFSDSAMASIALSLTEFSAQNTVIIERSSETVIKDIFGRDILYSLLLLILFAAILFCSRFIKPAVVETQKKAAVK